MHEVRAELTASVWKILARPGTPVAPGEEIAILESMKMEIPVEAPVGGVLTEFVVAEGASVQEGDLLARITAD
ncbi:biotin/lipoyl-binding carrier protein [Actinomadura formosensis]|uniref:biotin/lipoyl-binding carrier protein n=1 Tax=Actinomadura formosensis TaxID=60706 RepID=UPI00082CC13A|nr:biotin/lipoyl-binding carrier protein [Actinomadura formosensis]